MTVFHSIYGDCSIKVSWSFSCFPMGICWANPVYGYSIKVFASLQCKIGYVTVLRQPFSKISPIFPEFALLLASYFSKNFAGKIGTALIVDLSVVTPKFLILSKEEILKLTLAVKMRRKSFNPICMHTCYILFIKKLLSFKALRVFALKSQSCI